MKKIAMGGVAALLLLTGSSTAQAQFYYRPQTNPFYRPPLSPYLNLARPGDAGINYYGLVRPQVQDAQSIQQLQQQQLQLQQGATALDPTTGGVITGHPTRFGNYGHYFNYRGGAGALNTTGLATATPTTLGTALAPTVPTPPANTPRAAPAPGPKPPRR